MNKLFFQIALVFLIISSLAAQSQYGECVIKPDKRSEKIVRGNVWWYEFTVINESDNTIERPRIEVGYSSGVRLLRNERWKGKSGLNPREFAFKDQPNRKVYFSVPQIAPHSRTDMWVAFVGLENATHQFSADILIKSPEETWVKWVPPAQVVETIDTQTIPAETTVVVETTVAVDSIKLTDAQIDSVLSSMPLINKFPPAVLWGLIILSILILFLLLLVLFISVLVFFRFKKMLTNIEPAHIQSIDEREEIQDEAEELIEDNEFIETEEQSTESESEIEQEITSMEEEVIEVAEEEIRDETGESSDEISEQIESIEPDEQSTMDEEIESEIEEDEQSSEYVEETDETHELEETQLESAIDSESIEDTEQTSKLEELYRKLNDLSIE